MNFIPYGSENRIALDDLSRKIGLCRRSTCKKIKDARESGKPIFTDAQGGYWQPDFTAPKETVMQETERFRRYMLSRNSQKSVRAVDDTVNNIISGQLFLTDTGENDA